MVVIWKLDRPGRSLKHLFDMVSGFRDKGVECITLNNCIDTTTVQGHLNLNIFAYIEEFERANS
ncbi:recombinase family protein [Carboxylicivirga sp. RSCT41]|uniref:recombinase family protein n=1 Tax=Carboxylicivirga agarovorans TaxID=3417570 RepID=UPI003D32DF6D